MESPPEFHYFSQLPPELRLRVWYLASPKPSSLISSRFNTIRNEKWSDGTKASSIVQACRESRFEYLASSSSSLASNRSNGHPRYEICRFAPNFRRVFFSFEQDTLIMLAQDLRALRDIYYSQNNGTLEKEALEATSRVKHLALDINFFVDEDNCNTQVPYDVFPSCFKILEIITFLMQDRERYVIMDSMGGIGRVEVKDKEYWQKQRDSVALQFAAAKSRLPDWDLPVLRFRESRDFQRNPLN